MRARHAVLPTRSVSPRPTHLRTSSQSAYESPQIPFFVFKRLRTLSFSVSSKSFTCHSYENCRVCTNNSQTGTPHEVAPSEAEGLLSNLQSRCTQVLSFHTLAHSFALSCTLGKLNPFIFKRFRTPCEKHWGVGGGAVENSRHLIVRKRFLPG